LFSAGELGVLFALYIVTAVLSAVISNAAAVALMFPIGWEAVEQVRECVVFLVKWFFRVPLCPVCSFLFSLSLSVTDRSL
jgi:Na+/H+ antiporter NhaD/arsenite permease-like protein